MAIDYSGPAYFTCPTCGGKKDYYSRVCRTCKRLAHGEYRGYPGRSIDGVKKGLHVLVAERAIGKPLPPGAEVHHVNGVKSDSRNANLVICQDSAYHHLLHKRARILKAGGDPNTQRICSYCQRLRLFDQMVKQGESHPRGPVGTACKECVSARVKADSARKRAS